MAARAVPREDLEASAHASGVEPAEEGELWPVHVTLVGADFADLFLVPFDAPEGTDVISVQPALGFGVRVVLGVEESQSGCSDSVECRLGQKTLPSILGVIFDLIDKLSQIRERINI